MLHYSNCAMFLSFSKLFSQREVMVEEAIGDVMVVAKMNRAPFPLGPDPHRRQAFLTFNF